MSASLPSSNFNHFLYLWFIRDRNIYCMVNVSFLFGSYGLLDGVS